jgi:hypothetical protein
MTDSHAHEAPAGGHEPPTDSDISWDDRNRASRVASVSLVALASLAGPAIFGATLGSIYGPAGAWLLGTAGFAAGGYFISKILDRLYVYNEEWSSYVTNDPIFGHNVPYGPGFHFAHFWEERNQAGNYKLHVVTKTFEVTVQTTTASVTVKGSFQYRIDLALINRFIGISASTVEEGLLAFIKSFLIEELSDKDAEYSRKSITETNKKLKEKFVENEAMPVLEFEHQYGIVTVNLILEEIRLPQEAQQTRNAVDEASTLVRVLAQLSGMSPDVYTQRRENGQISDEQHNKLLDRAMAVSGNNARINVNTFEGNSAGVTPMLPIGNP